MQLEDEVVLIGEQGDERITAEELAAHTETIAWETVCGAELAIRRGRRTYIGVTRNHRARSRRHRARSFGS